jgi:hypothetical protein
VIVMTPGDESESRVPSYEHTASEQLQGRAIVPLDQNCQSIVLSSPPSGFKWEQPEYFRDPDSSSW